MCKWLVKECGYDPSAKDWVSVLNVHLLWTHNSLCVDEGLCVDECELAFIVVGRLVAVQEHG